MQSYLAEQERSWRPIPALVFGMVGGAIFCGAFLLLTLGVPAVLAGGVPSMLAGARWGDPILLIAGGAVMMGVAMGLGSFKRRGATCRDLRDGVYIRATGRIELESAWDGEQTTYALLVGERRFGIRRGDFERLWASLDGKAAAPSADLLSPPANLLTPAWGSKLRAWPSCRASLESRAFLSLAPCSFSDRP
jgi:hypothetical protein